MTGTHSIDTSFNVFQDTPAGKDPDVYSSTLKRYHQLLWSKPLPDGPLLQLNPVSGGDYLIAEVEGERLALSSDASASGFNQSRALWDLVSEAEYVRERHISAIIAGFILWPQRKRAGKITINGAKGFSPRIKDRFDLTLECVRRHYSGGESPLGEALQRYADYFA